MTRDELVAEYLDNLDRTVQSIARVPSRAVVHEWPEDPGAVAFEEEAWDPSIMLPIWLALLTEDALPLLPLEHLVPLRELDWMFVNPPHAWLARNRRRKEGKRLVVVPFR